MDDGLEIELHKDLNDKEFKENFFYHFDKRETIALTVALIIGGIIYAICFQLGIKVEITNKLITTISIILLLCFLYYTNIVQK